jgi:hypothetical protein
MSVDDPVAVVLNLPSAYFSAVFAPTPMMLLSRPAGVSPVRQWMLIEMTAYYGVLVLAVVGVSRMARGGLPHGRLAAVLLLGWFTLAHYGLLGTVVLNAGTLYRMRMPLFLTQCVFAAAGLGALAALAWRRRLLAPAPAREARA